MVTCVPSYGHLCTLTVFKALFRRGVCVVYEVVDVMVTTRLYFAAVQIISYNVTVPENKVQTFVDIDIIGTLGKNVTVILYTVDQTANGRWSLTYQ
jgi:hypothetical protein